MFETYRSLSDPFAALDITLWIICISVSLIVAIYTIYKLKYDPKEINDLQYKNATTWALTFLFLALANTLNLIWRYNLSDDDFGLTIDNLSVFLVNLALFIKIFQTEYTINKYEFYKGYYFTFATIGLMIFTVIMTPQALRQVSPFQSIYLILLIAGGSIFPLIFLSLAIKLKGKERQMALRMLNGGMFLAVGLLFQPHNIDVFIIEYEYYELIYNLFLILCPIFLSLAIIIILSSYINNL